MISECPSQGPLVFAGYSGAFIVKGPLSHPFYVSGVLLQGGSSSIIYFIYLFGWLGLAIGLSCTLLWLGLGSLVLLGQPHGFLV